MALSCALFMSFMNRRVPSFSKERKGKGSYRLIAPSDMQFAPTGPIERKKMVNKE